MVRKLYTVLLFLIAVFFLHGCSNKRKEVHIDNKEPDYFVYPLPYFHEYFYVDDEGVLYYPTEKKLEDYIEIDGAYTNVVSTLNIVNPLGNTIKTLDLPFLISGKFQIIENILYYFDWFTDLDYNPVLFVGTYNLEDESMQRLVILEDVHIIKNFEVTSQGIYIMGEDRRLSDKSYSLADPMDSFFYSGECMVYIDLDSLSVTRLDVEFPISFSATIEEKALVYAYDEEKGYYFVKCDGRTNQASEKMYKNLRNLRAFVCGKEKDMFFYQYSTLIDDSIAALSTSKNERWDLLSNVWVDFSYAQLSGDYLYYKNYKNDKKIERIRYEDYMNGNKTINIISTYMEAYMPFGAGFKLSREYPSLEAFSLAVLSNDSNFDLAFLHSSQDISENIRNKGSFYPLNEVKGVKEYLDTLFPYIKEAATTEDGNIWMIPINVDITFLIYDKENCKDAGFDFSKNINIIEFSDIMRSIREDDILREKVSYSEYPFIDTVFASYMREYRTFDSKLFSLLAKEVKDVFNPYNENPMYMNIHVERELFEKNKNKPLFALNNSFYMFERYQSSFSPLLEASKFPVVGDNTKSVATTLFLIVNPASKNLEETLTYIGKLCDNLMQSDSTKIFRNNAVFESDLEKEIHKIYEDGEIVFTLPEELYMDSFYDYMRGKIELSEMIKESNRKLNIYLKE